ncbi:MFS transporter [Patescibacteria group bacterium]|nr:MFS transporter [Patescibacteria group bacterium]MBU3999794.1 MFS transporter [Patescibacteria group bacterium]MBU4056648.1 MFS transporter [Patescibacteria group bacterium]MBU4368741.1 MFS transporter [Patescibacteria group bacterium]
MSIHIKELKNFYISVSLYNFAFAIIALFIPLYLSEKGFSISLIFLFFAISQAGRLLALPIAAYFSSIYGAKKMISAALVFQIIYLVFLHKIDYLSVNFFASALILGVVQSFLWPPYWIHLSKISPNESRGKILGRLNIFIAVATAVSPFVGGVVIAHYGFGSAFFLTAILIIPAIALLLSTVEVSNIRKINFKLVSLRKIYPDLIANGFANIQQYLNNALWPIFIFIVVPQYKSIGFIQTFSLIISIAVFYLVGVWVDKFNRKKLLLLGSISDSVIGAVRVLANSFSQVFIFNILALFTENLKSTPFITKFQEHMDQDARTEYMFLFEIGGTIITLVGLAIMAILFSSMPVKESLVLGLIIASVSGLFVNFVRK